MYKDDEERKRVEKAKKKFERQKKGQAWGATLMEVGGRVLSKALRGIEGTADFGFNILGMQESVKGKTQDVLEKYVIPQRVQDTWYYQKTFADKHHKAANLLFKAAEHETTKSWFDKPFMLDQLEDKDSKLSRTSYFGRNVAGEVARAGLDMGGELYGSLILGSLVPGGEVAEGASGAAKFMAKYGKTIPIGIKHAGQATERAKGTIKEQEDKEDLTFEDRMKSIAYGTSHGIAQWGISQISSPGEITPNLKGSGKEIFKAAAGEGMEGVLMDLIDKPLRKIAHDKEVGWYSEAGDTWVDTTKDHAVTFGVGTGMSLLFQASQGLFGREARDERREKRYQKGAEMEHERFDREIKKTLGTPDTEIEAEELGVTTRERMAKQLEAQGLEDGKLLARATDHIEEIMKPEEVIETADGIKIRGFNKEKSSSDYDIPSDLDVSEELDVRIKGFDKEKSSMNYEELSMPGDEKLKVPSIEETVEFEDLRKPEYLADPVGEMTKEDNKFMTKYRESQKKAYADAPEYRTEAADTVYEGLSEKERQVFEDTFTNVKKKQTMSTNYRLAKDQVRDTFGFGESMDLDSEGWADILSPSANITPSVALTAADELKTAEIRHIDLAKVAKEAGNTKLATEHSNKAFQANQLYKEAMNKTVQIGHEAGIDLNELQYNAETASGVIRNSKNSLEKRAKTDKEKWGLKKYNPENYVVSEQKELEAHRIWEADTKLIEEAEKAGKWRKASRLMEKRGQKMFAHLFSDVPGSWGEKFREQRQIGFLFNPKTMGFRNPMGNVESIILDKTNPFKALINKFNKWRGKDTSLTAEENLEMAKRFVKGAKEGASESWQDTSQSGKAVWGHIRGERDLDTVGGSDSKYLDIDSRVGEGVAVSRSEPLREEYNVKGSGALDRDGFFGKFGDLTYNLLDLADNPIHAGYMEAEIYRAGILLDKAEKAGTIKFRNPAERQQAILKAAKQRADIATFKDDNMMTEGMMLVKNVLNKVSLEDKTGFGIGDYIFTFVKTPANVGKMFLEHTPVALLKDIPGYIRANKMLNETGSAFDFMEFDQASRRVAESVYGTVLLGLFVKLADAGIIESFEHKRGKADQTKFNREKLGKTGIVINIGGKQIPAANLPIVNMFAQYGTGHSDKKKELEKLKEQGIDEGAWENFLTVISAGAGDALEGFFEQASMKKINEYIKAYQNEGVDGLRNTLARHAAEFPAEIIPTWIASIAKGVDPYERQIYEKGVLGGLTAGAAKIPGVSMLFPKKVDVFGEEIKNYDNLETFIKHFASETIMPSKVRERDDDPVVAEIERVGLATGKNIYPSSIGGRVDGKDLRRGEIVDYQKTEGQQYYSQISELMQTETYQNATDEEKAKLIRDKVKTPAKQLRKHGKEEIPEDQYKDVTISNMLEKSGISPKIFSDIKYMGGSQTDVLNHVGGLDLGIDQKIILLRMLYPDTRNITDDDLAQSMINVGLSNEEILNYGKLAGLIGDSEPIRYDTESINREAYNEMLYDLQPLDARGTMTDSLLKVLPEEAPQIIEEARQVGKNEEMLVEYLERLEIDGIQKLILYKKINPRKDEELDDIIANYIVEQNLTKDEMIRILHELGIL